jgi:hypothetical protein
VEDMCYDRRGLCGLVCPSRTSESGGEGDCVKEGGGEAGVRERERERERALGPLLCHMSAGLLLLDRLSKGRVEQAQSLCVPKRNMEDVMRAARRPDGQTSGRSADARGGRRAGAQGETPKFDHQDHPGIPGSGVAGRGTSGARCRSGRGWWRRGAARAAERCRGLIRAEFAGRLAGNVHVGGDFFATVGGQY